MQQRRTKLEGVHTLAAVKRRCPDGRVFLNEYLVKEKLADSSSCSVFRVEAPDGVSFCCKRFRKALLLRQREYRGGAQGFSFVSRFNQVQQEALILSSLNHPRCLRLIEVLDTNADDENAKIYFVTSFVACGPLMEIQSVSAGGCDGSFPRSASLGTCSSLKGGFSSLPSGSPGACEEVFVPLLKGQRTFTEAQAKCFVRDAALGLAYLHDELRICHRDVKLDNLLLDADGRVVVGDFGCAEALDAEGRVKHTKGTYTFMAPECLRVLEKSQVYTGHDGRAADVWALGVSAFVLIFGVPPFNSQSLEGLFNCICSQELSLPADVEVSEEFGDFLRRVLQKDSTERLTIKQVLNHPWVSSADYSESAAYAKKLLSQKQKPNLSSTATSASSPAEGGGVQTAGAPPHQRPQPNRSAESECVPRLEPKEP